MDILGPQCAAQSVGLSNQLVSLLFQTILTAQCSISPPEFWPADYGPTILANGLGVYDFIIVGAGSAGSVVANRLSENPNWKILLLEAGGDPPIESQVPFLYPGLFNTPVDWQFLAERSTKFGRGIPKGLPISRGKMLGGSGSMNAMFYIRGTRQDYDDWAAAGNPTWDFDSVLPYFIKSENMIPDDVYNAYGGGYHGRGGYMSIDHFNISNIYKTLLLEGLEEMGDKYLIDINGPEQIGTFESTGNLANGLRQGPATAFLSSVKSRPNLHVVKHAYVTQLQIDSYGKVQGVNFFMGGKYHVAVAQKEYILSAGSINSPQILMNSGIGPRSHLQEFGIPTIKDLPIGKNFHDHLLVLHFLEVPQTELFNPVSNILSYFEYLTQRTGYFATNFVSDVVSYFNAFDPDSTDPNIEVHHAIAQRGDTTPVALFLSGIGYEPEYIANVVEAVQRSSVIVMAVTMLTSKSKGRVKLRSANPFEPIRIFPNFLDHPDDVQTLIAGIRRQQQLLNTRAFRRFGVSELWFRLRDCPFVAYDSDEYWDCYIRYAGTTLYHPAGTVKMGPKRDRSTCVNHRLRVHGIKNLRVCDSSIMPEITKSNTNAPTIMIGEKGADMIKETWNYRDPTLDDF